MNTENIFTLFIGIVITLIIFAGISILIYDFIIDKTERYYKKRYEELKETCESTTKRLANELNEQYILISEKDREINDLKIYYKEQLKARCYMYKRNKKIKKRI